MTHLRIELNTTGIEEVSSAVIAKLYDIVHSGTLDNTSNLLGRLHTTATYLDYVDYLEGLFDGTNDKGPLYITANKYYQSFEDPEVQRILASTYGDGTGVTRSELANVSEIMDLFKGNTTITKFNEFKYFTGIDHDNIVWQADWFTGCTNLREITIPKNVKYMASNSGTFTNCSSLETVTFDPISSLKEISGFRNCTSLTNISIPDSVLEINGEAFRGCTSLQTFDAKNATVLGGNAFKQCSSLTSVTALNVTTIRNECFSSSGLVTLTYDPNKIVYLDSEALSCGTLVINDLSLPNLTYLGSSVFAGSKIGTVSNLGSTITSIPNNTFLECNLLTSVTLPSQVTEIGSRAFYNCSSLTTINLSNITKIGERTFADCSSLGAGLTLELNLSSQTNYPHDILYGTAYTRLILHSPLLTGEYDNRYPLYESMRQLTYLDLSDWRPGKNHFDHSTYVGGSFYNNDSLVTYIAPINTTDMSSIIKKLGEYRNFRYLILLATTPPIIKTDDNNNPPSGWFYGLDGNVHIYVPDSAKAAYLADSDWSTIGGYNGSDTITDRLHGLSELPAGVWTTGLASLYLTPALLATS